MRVMSDKGRKRLSEKMTEQNFAPEFSSAARSERMREKWADPEYREDRAKTFYATQPDDAAKLPPDTLDV